MVTKPNPDNAGEVGAGEKHETKNALKPGDVVRLADNAYGLVVGTEKVKHVHPKADGTTESDERSHPLIVDLPAPRRHEVETYAAE